MKQKKCVYSIPLKKWIKFYSIDFESVSECIVKSTWNGAALCKFSHFN